MPSLFIGVYVALYPYTAQTEQEISVEQGDLLYLLEKSQEDDWWKVKKRVLGAETEEPVGLVPNNYVQQVSLIKARLCWLARKTMTLQFACCPFLQSINCFTVGSYCKHREIFICIRPSDRRGTFL